MKKKYVKPLIQSENIVWGGVDILLASPINEGDFRIGEAEIFD